MVEQTSSLAVIKQKGRRGHPFLLTVMNGIGNVTDATLPFADKEELRRHASWQEETIIFSHFRDKDKVEIDVVLESGGRVAGVEVKAAATVTNDDFKGLRKLQDAVKERFAAGVVLYDGGSVVPFGSNLYAVPIYPVFGRQTDVL